MKQQIIPTKGKLLIAEPFLSDSHFSRSVILLCEIEEEGAIGFVINRPSDETLDQFIPEFDGMNLPIYYGGPVQMDRLHFLHCCPELIDGGMEITDGIYWGGDFDTAKTLIQSQQIDGRSIRFFLGYAGWEQKQLDRELEEQSWIITDAELYSVFTTDENSLWKSLLQDMGGDYAIMANFPLNPSFN